MTSQAERSGGVVLVALDGSPAAATALPVAQRVARRLGAKVEVLHVREDGEEALGPLQFGGANAPVRELRGDPAAAILDAAAAPAVEMVVLTTHGRTIEPDRGLGHVAGAVVAATARPVLLVRPEAPAPAADAAGPPALLVPLDGTPSTASALPPAMALAARAGASIDLLYVADPAQERPGEAGSITAPRYVDQPQHEWPQWTNEVIARLARACAACPPGVAVQMYLATGDAGEEVVRFAAEHAPDAIVLVRRSRMEAGRARILRSILDKTPSPILLVGGRSRPNGGDHE